MGGFSSAGGGPATNTRAVRRPHPRAQSQIPGPTFVFSPGRVQG
jgi:hypothetical protein